MAERRGAPGTGEGAGPTAVVNTSSRFDAGSVLTSNTFLPASASAIATAQAVDVLPTPPLPVKKRLRVSRSSKPRRFLTAATLAGRGCDLYDGRLREARAELGARRVAALAHDFSIGEHERQAGHAVLVERSLHDGVGHERAGLVAQVVARDGNAALLE